MQVGLGRDEQFDQKNEEDMKVVYFTPMRQGNTFDTSCVCGNAEVPAAINAGYENIMG